MKFRDVTPMDVLEMLERRLEEVQLLDPQDRMILRDQVEELRAQLQDIYNNNFDEKLREL
ncbi:MAG: hypothetical protein VW270_18595 [Candidatus Poseidoniales archaeon]|jgi:hypothetical protein